MDVAAGTQLLCVLAAASFLGVLLLSHSEFRYLSFLLKDTNTEGHQRSRKPWHELRCSTLPGRDNRTRLPSQL